MHDLPKLLQIAGLELDFEQEAGNDPDFRRNWAVVKDWNEETRYQSRGQQQAQEILTAITDAPTWSFAMVKKKLVEELIKDGVKLLHELDRQKLPVESLFWIHMPYEDYWRLIIASDIVAKQGGAAAYRRLGELLQGIELAGVNLEDISLLDPSSEQSQLLLAQASESSRLAAGEEWTEFEDAIFYRFPPVSGELDCDASWSELSQLWEAERKISNQPSLLIGLTGRIITLRFHPQHGRLQGLENIKRAFVIALHRSRRDCNIKWLS